MNYLHEKDNLIEIPFNYHYGTNFRQEKNYQNEFCRPYWKYNDTPFFHNYNKIIQKYNNSSYLSHNNSFDEYNNRNFDDVREIHYNNNSTNDSETNVQEKASYPIVNTIEISK